MKSVWRTWRKKFKGNTEATTSTITPYTYEPSSDFGRSSLHVPATKASGMHRKASFSPENKSSPCRLDADDCGRPSTDSQATSRGRPSGTLSSSPPSGAQSNFGMPHNPHSSAETMRALPVGTSTASTPRRPPRPSALDLSKSLASPSPRPSPSCGYFPTASPSKQLPPSPHSPFSYHSNTPSPKHPPPSPLSSSFGQHPSATPPKCLPLSPLSASLNQPSSTTSSKHNPVDQLGSPLHSPRRTVSSSNTWNDARRVEAPIHERREIPFGTNKRRMPELDGIWAGFLQDADEDCDSVASITLDEYPLSTDYYPSLEDLQIPQLSPQKPVTLRPTLTPSRSVRTLTPATEHPYPIPPKTRLHNSKSAPSLPQFCKASEDDGFSLSLFPPVPPLIVNREHIIPKINRTCNTGQTPPLSPASTCNMDLTPAATPVTPKFPYSSVPHTIRQFPHLTSKNSTTLSGSIALRPSFSSSGSSGSSRPVTPPSPEVPACHQPSKLSWNTLRNAHSSAQLRPLPMTKMHRTTSSDSVSDHSDSFHCSRLLSNDSEQVMLNPDYLRSQGRLPSQHQPKLGVRFGYAL